MLKLNNIVDKGSTKSSKRVGRGIGSGKGKTSGAGHKGQKSRSGVAIKGFEGGQMPLHRRLPKRGFKNPFRKEYSIINLVDISKAIDSKKLDPLKEINKDVLAKAGLIRKKTIGVKLLGNGKISHKITIRVNKVSKKATDELSKIKGKLILESIKDANDLKEKSSKKKES
ncbi:MAG: 50S ribosomal protein L15 [Pseudomonadota bacterium]|nr:50S ribosomal protein L15 [Pseudomonadota bacterium]